MRATVVDSPVGPLTLVANGSGLRELRFGEDVRAHGVVPADRDPLLGRAAEQLGAYFAGERRRLRLPLSWGRLSPFSEAVYDRMLAIPYGQVLSYGELAMEAGSPRASRAVGQACNRNPLPIVVPCHRVVAADGTLGGYGAGLEIKRRLLDLEQEGR